MTDRSIDRQLDEVAPLAEPVRRALYLHVVGQPGPVGRDAAAAAIGIGRALAAFHLDRLVDAGLLTADYRRLGGRTGPGAGRPAKVYQRSDRELAISVPERRYDLLAGLFARALETGTMTDEPVAAALDRAAHAYGRALGAEARRRAGSRPSASSLSDAAVGVLAEHGFEPAPAGDGTTEVVLRNCPFDAIAREHRQLVCGMNLSLMQGVLDGLRAAGLRVELDPQPGMCCVVWRSAASNRPPASKS